MYAPLCMECEFNMSLNYIKKDIKESLSEIDKHIVINILGDYGYTELKKTQKYLNLIKDMLLIKEANNNDKA